MELRDKTALVTGGGGGIGWGVARALAAAGCRVAITDRDADKLQQAVDSFDARPPILSRVCDVSNRDDVRSLAAWAAQELGPLDIVVNSAGVNVVQRRCVNSIPATSIAS